jgi:MOSC domain-containing protein YiiM
MPRVVSIQIGLPKELGDSASADPMDRPWRSGFYKMPVEGPVELLIDTIVGDGVADRVNHGGVDKAVLAYSVDHHANWCAELSMTKIEPGAFGENLSIEGADESNVCVGDVYRVADVELEVSQPRQPCWKLSRRWRLRELPARVVETGRTGWYLRVRKTGQLWADELKLIERPYPELSVQRLNDMMYNRTPVTRQAADCPVLAPVWANHFHKKLNA